MNQKSYAHVLYEFKIFGISHFLSVFLEADRFYFPFQVLKVQASSPVSSTFLYLFQRTIQHSRPIAQDHDAIQPPFFYPVWFHLDHVKGLFGDERMHT